MQKVPLKKKTMKIFENYQKLKAKKKKISDIDIIRFVVNQKPKEIIALLESTQVQTSQNAGQEILTQHSGVNKMLNLFKTVNPTINFGNTTQRKALDEILQKYGEAQTKKIIEYAISINGEQYAPVITTPHQLREKMGILMAYYKRNAENKNNVTKI